MALRPDSPVGHDNLGNALADLGRWPEALAAFEAALKLNPGFLPSLQRRGVALGSLGRLYPNRLEDFPATPYLSTSDEARGQWVEPLGPKTTRLRVGLSWRGGIPRTGRVERSLALADLKPLLAPPTASS